MTALVAAPILLTITLLTSGFAKLGGQTKRRATEDAMISLRLPMRSLHPLAAAVVPPAEILLAILLWIPVPAVQTVAAALTLALMAAYLVIIGRAMTFGEAVHCSCFGTLGSPTVSRATLWRNILLTALGILAVIAAVRGDIAAAVLEQPGELAASALAILTATALAVLAMGGLRPEAAAGDAAATSSDSRAATAGAPDPTSAHAPLDAQDGALDDEDDELEYERLPIPFGMLVERVDGVDTHRSVQTLLQEKAQLLIWVRPGCGPCVRTIAQMGAWRERLGPMVELRAMFAQPLEHIPADALESAGSTSSYDVEGNLATAFSAHGTPSAVLLGADGLTAGGPVVGGPAVEEFVEQIIEQLGEIPQDEEKAEAVAG